MAGPAQKSVLRSLNQLAGRLDRALKSLGASGDAQGELLGIADGLIEAVAEAPDVALASIYLNQVAGPYAVRHCIEAAVICCVIAPAESDACATVAAALTMNSGMARLSDARDYVLTEEERDAVRRHPAESAELLRRAGVSDPDWLAFVLLHHASGDEVPAGARLVGMADRYCAMVSARNYRRSMLPPEALAKLCLASGDARLAALFQMEIGEYPPGTLVQLANGETGVVSSRRAACGAIRVHTFRDTLGVPFAPVEQRSTREPEFAIEKALHEDSAGLRFSMRQIWGDAAAL